MGPQSAFFYWTAGCLGCFGVFIRSLRGHPPSPDGYPVLRPVPFAPFPFRCLSPGPSRFFVWLLPHAQPFRPERPPHSQAPTTPMLNLFLDPPHIRHAKAGLAAAGIPLEAGLAALNLARDFYLATPQGNRAEVLRQERNRTQDELERVSTALVQARKRALRLEQALTQLGALPVRKGVLRMVVKRFRAIREALLHGTWPDAQKVARARELLDQALVGLAAQQEAREEQDQPLIVVQTQLVRVERAQHAAHPIPEMQRQRRAELEALLGRRSRFEQQLDRLLTQLHALITRPEAELWEAAGDNERLRGLVKKWGSLVGMLENLLVTKEQPGGSVDGLGAPHTFGRFFLFARLLSDPFPQPPIPNRPRAPRLRPGHPNPWQRHLKSVFRSLAWRKCRLLARLRRLGCPGPFGTPCLRRRPNTERSKTCGAVAVTAPPGH